MSVTVQSGRPTRGKIASAASITPKPITPYTAITRNTFRRFISANRRGRDDGLSLMDWKIGPTGREEQPAAGVTGGASAYVLQSRQLQ